MAEVPAADIDALRRWLIAHHFEQVDRLEGTAFGDLDETWTFAGSVVRVWRDRGQWFVDVGRAGWSEAFDVDLVAWVLGVKDNGVVERIAASCDANLDHLLPALVEAREQRSRARGLLPPRHPYNDDRP